MQTLMRARYIRVPLPKAEFTRSALRKYVDNVASRPYCGPLKGEALAMLERDYGQKKLGHLIIALAQIHSGKITKNSVIGQAHRLGLCGHSTRRKRLLTGGL